MIIILIHVYSIVNLTAPTAKISILVSAVMTAIILMKTIFASHAKPIHAKHAALKLARNV
jgi:hypothetical protein